MLGAPTFAHECRRRLPAGVVAKRRVGGLPPNPNETTAGRPFASSKVKGQKAKVEGEVLGTPCQRLKNERERVVRFKASE